MSYSEATATLSSAVAQLLAAGPPSPHAAVLAGEAAVRALAARDILVIELRQLAVELVGPPTAAGQGLGPEHLVSDPLRVLHSALHQLPAALTDATARPDRGTAAGAGRQTAAPDDEGALCRLWAQVARGAVQLEASHHRIRMLPPEAAAEVAGELAQLAAAACQLDADLAAQLPAGRSAAVSALQAPVPHGLLRLSADQLSAQLLARPVTVDHRELLDAALARAMLLRTGADLPEGMRRITAVLAAVGPDLATLDLQGVARLLAVGLQTADRRGAIADGDRPAAATAVQALRHAATGSLAMLAPPDPRLRMLTSEVYRQVRAGEQQVPGTVLVDWLREVPATAAALSTTVAAAGSAGRLFGRPGETGEERRGDIGRLWVRVPPAETQEHPVAIELRSAADTLDQLRPAAPLPGAAPVVYQVAAASAARAALELRTALVGRSTATRYSGSPDPNRQALQHSHPSSTRDARHRS